MNHVDGSIRNPKELTTTTTTTTRIKDIEAPNIEGKQPHLPWSHLVAGLRWPLLQQGVEDVIEVLLVVVAVGRDAGGGQGGVGVRARGHGAGQRGELGVRAHGRGLHLLGVAAGSVVGQHLHQVGGHFHGDQLWRRANRKP